MKVDKKKITVAIVSYLFVSFATSIIGLIKRRRGRVRRFAVRPMNRKRNIEGHFATLINDMKYLEVDSDQFFKYTRMTPTQFAHLLQLVGPYLQKDKRKNPLSPEHRLMITIHYLSEGPSMQEIAWGYRIGKTTAHKIIKETCKVLWDVLSPRELPVPKIEDWEAISLEFYKRWNMPNCIGSVDGKHVNIQAPKNSGSDFFNYKKSFSVILLATCDAYYRFTMVDIGAAGSNHDSAVFKSSAFGLGLLNGELDIPPDKELPNTNLKMPYYLVGDAAFPLHKNLIRPFPGNNLGEKKNIFNYRLSRARRTIENTFGILSQRWRILRKPIVASLEVSELIVQATVVLHNFLQTNEKDIPISERRYCPTGFADYIDSRGDIQPGAWREEEQRLRSVNRLGSNNPTNSAKVQRDNLADYFISCEGWLPWQEDYVHRGGVPLD